MRTVGGSRPERRWRFEVGLERLERFEAVRKEWRGQEIVHAM